MKKKILIGIGVILLLLIITNPSMRDFKEYSNGIVCKRESNFLLFSIYSRDYHAVSAEEIDDYEDFYAWKNHSDKIKYIAIAKNFFYLKSNASENKMMATRKDDLKPKNKNPTWEETTPVEELVPETLSTENQTIIK